MTITEIVRYFNIQEFVYTDPYILKAMPSKIDTPQWWIDIGGIDISNKETINITSVLLKPSTQYSRVNSYNDLLSQDTTFYFDSATQELFIHLSLDVSLPTLFSYGKASGYSDSDTVIYIDDVLYQPLLKSVPSFAKQVDLAKYNQLSFLSGNHIFDNSNEDFDIFIDEDIYGNDIFDYYLPQVDGTYDYSRTELIPLAAFYVEDYQYSLGEFNIVAQDKRKSQDINILDKNETPLIYGTISACKVNAIDDEIESPQFRLGLHLTDLGQVQVESDFGWVNATPYDIDLSAGTFNLSYVDCRRGGVIDGTLLPVRVINFTGVVNASALDVIVDINQKVLGIEYTATNYDITAWESAKIHISDISTMFNTQQTVYEAIRKIQAGSNIGFRYDINPDGKRTIILDDWNKDKSRSVAWSQIKDNMTLTVNTNSEIIAGIVNIKYNKEYEKDTYKIYENTSKYNEVLNRYRTAPTYEIETLINKEADAIQKSNQILERYSKVPKTLNITLHGSEFYDLKIFDIVNIDLSVENGRQYFGKWKVQITAIAPNIGTLENQISALLLERIYYRDYLILGDSLGLIGDSLGIVGDINKD